MNCYLHPDTAAVAYCRACGRALCPLCQRPSEGTVFCPEHVPAAAGAYKSGAPPNPYVQPDLQPGVRPVVPPAVQTSPGLAFLLGLIPGVGAIYNGQYMKGLVHAVIFGLLISFANSASNTAGQPMLAILVAAFYFYMPFEAYHTARKRQLGVAVDEWSSLVSQDKFNSRVPIGPIILILLGVLFLLDSLGVIAFREVGRFWPVILILIGGGMLYSRLNVNSAPSGAVPPPRSSFTRTADGDIVESGREL